MSQPTNATLAGTRYLALRKLGLRTDRAMSELLQLYALEGFLSRLAQSPERDRFVLKGGMLLAAMDARRPTRDVDLLALRVSNDAIAIREIVVAIAAVDVDDGLGFDLGATDVETIREADAYSGVRVTLHAGLSSAKLLFHVDVNVGDPVWPGAEDVQLPRLLDDEPIVVRGYPVTMVLAEKIVTAMQRGTANTRWRDFADIVLLARLHPIHGPELHRAIRDVAAFRQAPLRALREVLQGFAHLAQPNWRVWRRRQRLEDRLPEDFIEVLTIVLRVADPVVVEERWAAEWNPAEMAWIPASDGLGTT